MDYEKMTFKAKFEYENIPRFLQEFAKDEFMRLRVEAVDIFNGEIDRVNNMWKTTGKETFFGEYIEDINPEYSKFIIDEIQPLIDKQVNCRSGLVKVYIGPYGDLCGGIKGLKGSRITLYMFPYKET